MCVTHIRGGGVTGHSSQSHFPPPFSARNQSEKLSNHRKNPVDRDELPKRGLDSNRGDINLIPKSIKTDGQLIKNYIPSSEHIRPARCHMPYPTNRKPRTVTYPNLAKFVHIVTMRFFVSSSGDLGSRLRLKKPKWNM